MTAGRPSFYNDDTDDRAFCSRLSLAVVVVNNQKSE